MSFRGWTRILPIWLIEKWARTFGRSWIEIKGKKYIAFSLYADMTLIIDEQKYDAQERPKEERKKEIYAKKMNNAELKMLDIVNKYPEIKETYFKKEDEDDYDE